MGDFDRLRPGLIPPAAGQANVGATCYFNALAQCLLGCTSVMRAALALEAAGAPSTAAGRALGAFYRAALAGDARAAGGLVAALRAEAAARRPTDRVRFDGGNESASEALALLLDLATPDPASGIDPAAAAAADPVARLFLHRRAAAVVRACAPGCPAAAARAADETSGGPSGGQSVGSPPAAAAQPTQQSDFGVVMVLHDPPPGEPEPATPEEFARRLVARDDPGEPCAACGGPTRHVSRLRLAPEVLVVAFPIYDASQVAPVPPVPDSHRARYFPARLALGPAVEYAAVGQVVHGGGMGGGHYWAQCLRAPAGGSAATLAGLEPWRLDDSNASPGVVGPQPGTYLVFYHML